MLAHFKEDCPHVESPDLFPIEDFAKIDFANLKCENCEEKEELWICLFCGKAFCSRYKNSHFVEHNSTNPEHRLCLGIMDLSVWCYDCLDINNHTGDNKGCYIKSEKTDEYFKIYYDYKFPKEDKLKEEKAKKENITYSEQYQNEIEEKCEEDLCQHIKNLTKEDWEKSPFIKVVNDYVKIKEEIIFDLLCFSCDNKIHIFDELKSHHNNKKHNIYIDLNELSIICMECKSKFSINVIKDKLTLEQKTSLGLIIERFPICPKFLTEEEIFQIKYNKFISNFISGKYKNIIFMVGAGISTSAGIPDFRSGSGLFKQLQEKYNLSGPEEFFYKSTFLKNPMFFYEFTKLFDLSQTKPTIAHKFMNFMINKNFIKYVFTQNIDGLEIKAKIPQEKLIFAHGNFIEGHCAKCYKDIDIENINEGIKKGEVYYCPDCKGPCKPKIVFYGENLPKRFYDCLNDIKDVDLIIIMGTSLKVYPFAAIPEFAGENTGIIVFNMEKVGNFNYNKIAKDELFIKGKTDENILKFLEDTKLYEEFKKFIKETYNEELSEIIGKDIKLMNVKELEEKEKEKEKNKVDKLREEIEKLNLDEKKDEDEDEDEDLK